MPTIIRINLTEDHVGYEEISHGHPYEFYAGRSFTSKIVAEEVPPLCDPLREENKLIFSCGFLSGTNAPNSGRISIGAKSPLTNGIKEANVGGRAPYMLASQDIRGIIFEGCAPEWKLITIFNGKAEIRSAEDLVGLDNYALMKKLMEEFGSSIGIFSIGRAGEAQLPAASIASCDMEGYPSRHAARGGLGAVMGSKKIKAIITKTPKPRTLQIKDAAAFNSVSKPWAKSLYSTKRKFSMYGTALLVNTMNEHHGLPTHNFRRGSFEGAESISGEALNEYIEKNGGKYGLACSPGCVIRCSNLVKGKNGEHITSSLEYETIALNGSNLLIDNIETLAWIDHYADDLGIDTIELGNTLAVMMEAGLIAWGDGDAVLSLLKNFDPSQEKTKKIGLGCYRLGKELGVERIVHVKKQGLPAYEPRTFKGMGITFLTSPMGADHTAGPAILNRKAYANKEYGPVYDPRGKTELSRELQIFIMIMDSMGLCYFVGPSYENAKKVTDLTNARFGWDKDVDFWIRWAAENLLMEHNFNVKAGCEPEFEWFPDFLSEVPQEDIDHRWDVSKEEIKNFWKEFEEIYIKKRS